MNVKRIISIALAVAVISFVAPAYVNAQPPAMPHTFYGTLVINDIDAPIGTIVEARVEGVINTVDNPITTDEIGKYGGPDWPAQNLAVQGTITPGATITFWVQRPTDTARHQADQTAEWESMKVEVLNLTVDIPVTSAGGGGGGGGGGAPDTTPPVISGISLCGTIITETAVNICWETSEPSTSQVEYWSSPGMLSTLDETLATTHRVRLTGLTPGTTYHYKTMSKDRAGNLAVSTENTFTTLGAAPAPPAPAPPAPAPAPPAPAPPAPAPPEVAEPINWPVVGGIIAGVIVVGLLIFFLVRRRAY